MSYIIVFTLYLLSLAPSRPSPRQVSPSLSLSADPPSLSRSSPDNINPSATKSTSPTRHHPHGLPPLPLRHSRQVTRRGRLSGRCEGQMQCRVGVMRWRPFS
ncbi:hypothetical protein E2C01_102274 [Portunus trituberculatus]|uniref:Uncharacterized protein n=1 Tax=Portunus trituberculatus TaxID=210409 RepID=A0A5B7KC48_PORTR|nr:hypothetical protein [Portunus trituberculatus]